MEEQWLYFKFSQDHHALNLISSSSFWSLVSAISFFQFSFYLYVKVERKLGNQEFSLLTQLPLHYQ